MTTPPPLRTVVDDWLTRYLAAFDRVPGWTSPAAPLLFMAYHQLLADEGVDGDVLEIGVHHGAASVGMAALRRDDRRFVVVDLFDVASPDQVTRTEAVARTRFLATLRLFYDDPSFLTLVAAPSPTLTRGDIGAEFSFCHVGGGRSLPEAYADLELAATVTLPGGLIALDDYFNPSFPGVGEAAIRFSLRHEGDLKPIAIGDNTVLFQRQPGPFDLNARFAQRFPAVFSSSATLWGVKVPVFDAAFGAFFDTARSSARRLIPTDRSTVGARIEPVRSGVTAYAGGAVVIPVYVTNLSCVPLARGASPFGLSYHVWGAPDRQLLRFDNPRTWFDEPLLPGAGRTVNVPVEVPDAPGLYEIEFDVVWEGVLWMKDHGNPTGQVHLSAVAPAAMDAVPLRSGDAA